MISRFRIEVAGVSKDDCARQLEFAVLAVFDIDGTSREDWEVTDDVSWKNGPDYRARIVMKLKGSNG